VTVERSEPYRGAVQGHRARPLDVVQAVLAACRHGENAYDVYNVATGDYITVTEIAELAVEVLGLAPGTVQFRYSGGDRGWKGNVPVVRLATERIRRHRLALPVFNVRCSTICVLAERRGQAFAFFYRIGTRHRLAQLDGPAAASFRDRQLCLDFR
jgi:hypothetical protein